MGSQRRSLPPLFPRFMRAVSPRLVLRAGAASAGLVLRAGAASAGLLLLRVRAMPAGLSLLRVRAMPAGLMQRAEAVAAALLLLAGTAQVVAANVGVRADGDLITEGGVSQDPLCLQAVVEELRVSCGHANLRVAWSLSGTVAARLATAPAASVVRVQGDGCSDRVVVQVTLGEGAGTNRYLLTGGVEIWGQGLRANRTLRAGTILTSEDVTEGEGWFPPSAFRGTPPDVEGAHVVEAIPVGQVVGADDIGPPPLVKRGETIHVVYRARGLELRTLGTARRDGWMGDRLAIRAVGSQHDCTGIVAGPDVVEVHSEGRHR